jgi:hypothetical protein
MCRIDAPYGNLSLDEKKDPVERFLQALDEFKVQGNFRALLIKHFSENWKSIFYNVSRFEEVLSKANEQNSEPEKCIALAFNSNINIQFQLKPFLDDDSYRDSLLFHFLNDVANEYFPQSPYGFYKSGIENHVPSYAWFVQNHYSVDHFFAKEFFDDETLCSLSENERRNLLWRCFYFLAPPFECLSHELLDSALVNGLISLITSNEDSSSLTKDAQSIQLGLAFLNAWIRHDSKLGRLSCEPSDFFSDSPWERLESLSWLKDFGEQLNRDCLTNWLEKTKLEFDKVIVLNFHSDSFEISKWASSLEKCFRNTINNAYRCIDWEASHHHKFYILKKREFEDLCSQLTPLQLEIWMRWSIQQDFELVLGSTQTLPELSKSSERWICEDYFDVWKTLFLEQLNELEVDKQLHVLSANLGMVRGESDEFRVVYYTWWRGLLRELPEKIDFPLITFPEWTVIALRSLHDENLVPYVDKSIGILRKEVAKTPQPEDCKRNDELLKLLLDNLDRLVPEKSLRHRLLLMRSYASPLTDESISTGCFLDQSNLTRWYIPINELATRLFGKNLDIQLAGSVESRRKALIEPYIICANELAEFYLSRLRLRKGQKATDKRYTVEQIVERSSVWRQGYLKALTELGVDLNGKVHKAVYFIRQSDPDPDVREIASECYKAVRRKTKKKSTITDLKRGIIAAEWWLLICQRQNLGFKISHGDALKTRRNLMRNL